MYSIIVNRDCIIEIRKYFKSRQIIVLNDNSNTKIKTGGTYNAQVNELLQI